MNMIELKIGEDYYSIELDEEERVAQISPFCQVIGMNISKAISEIERNYVKFEIINYE